MAEIETLIGVTKVNAFEYEVISEVSVGSGIDDLEYATFVQKSGGLLKFDNGCTTTFTNCKFVEETSAASAPGNKRFIANSSTAPVFKGCKFIIDHGSNGNGRGASDFDVSTGTSPTFDFSEDGSPCYFIRNNGGTSEAKANHYRSGTFNSFVVDQNGGGGAFEIMHPALTINDLTLKGRGYSNPLSSRHLIVYTSASQFHNNTTTFRKLKADNVSLFAGTNKNDNNVIIQVIDAKGRLLRAEDTPNSQRGYLQFLRTYQSAPVDATTLSATEVKCYLKNTDNSDIIIDGLTSGVDEGLLQYKYEHNATTTKGVITYDANDDPQTTGTFFTVANNYIRGFISYDRLPTSRTFKIEDRNDGSPLVHDVVLVDDSAITDTRVTTDAYQEIDTPQKFYNRAKAYLVDNYAGEAETLVSRDGNTINAGSYDVVVDASASSVFAISGNKLTIKATRFVGNISTTGTTTLSNDAKVIGTFGATTVLPWTVKNVEGTTRLQLYNLTKDSLVVTQKLTGAAGTYVDATGTYTQTEIAEGDVVRLRCTCAVGETAMLPTEITGVATSTGITFQVDQQADEVYNANGINGSTVEKTDGNSSGTLVADYASPMGVDVSDADGTASVKEIYAFFVYSTTTEDGVDKWFGGMRAIDNANYEIVTARSDIKIQNIGTNAVIVSDGRLFRDDQASVLYAENGDKPISMDSGALVTSVQPQVEAALNSNAKISSINNNSKLIPGLL